MSALSTPDLERAKAFYGAVFGWETDTFAVGDIEATLWRLPGFVGGEPSQPVPADVVAVAAPGDAPRWDVDLWVDDPDATAAKAAELGGSVLMPPDRHADRAASRARRPAGRDLLRQPRGARMSTIEVVNHITLDGVLQAPAHPDEDRRGGFEHGGWAVALPGRGAGRVHERADEPRRRRAPPRPLDVREVRGRLAEAAGGQPGPPGAGGEHEVRRLPRRRASSSGRTPSCCRATPSRPSRTSRPARTAIS